MASNQPNHRGVVDREAVLFREPRIVTQAHREVVAVRMRGIAELVVRRVVLLMLVQIEREQTGADQQQRPDEAPSQLHTSAREPAAQPPEEKRHGGHDRQREPEGVVPAVIDEYQRHRLCGDDRDGAPRPRRLAHHQEHRQCRHETEHGEEALFVQARQLVVDGEDGRSHVERNREGHEHEQIRRAFEKMRGVHAHRHAEQDEIRVVDTSLVKAEQLERDLQPIDESLVVDHPASPGPSVRDGRLFRFVDDARQRHVMIGVPIFCREADQRSIEHVVARFSRHHVGEGRDDLSLP